MTFYMTDAGREPGNTFLKIWNVLRLNDECHFKANKVKNRKIYLSILHHASAMSEWFLVWVNMYVRATRACVNCVYYALQL